MTLTYDHASFETTSGTSPEMERSSTPQTLVASSATETGSYTVESRMTEQTSYQTERNTTSTSPVHQTYETAGVTQYGTTEESEFTTVEPYPTEPQQTCMCFHPSIIIYTIT